MNEQKNKSPLFYPVLGAIKDLGFMRLSGLGLGNSFYTYFHAYLLAKKLGGRLLHPAWPSVKSGPLLRRDASKRSYVGLFRSPPDEISGIQKYVLLAKFISRSKLITINEGLPSDTGCQQLNLISCKDFTFRGLHEHRSAIRARLLDIVKEPTHKDCKWGAGNYIAVHVRLGDFVPTDTLALNNGATNIRLPITWYVEIVKQLQREYPGLPIYLFSDGRADQLQELLYLGVVLRRNNSDIADLLALSSASILVGSSSTYSSWAAFLGNMPSIWVAKNTQEEKPSASDVKIAYVPIQMGPRLSGSFFE